MEKQPLNIISSNQVDSPSKGNTGTSLMNDLTVKEYQAKREHILNKEKDDVLGDYMDLTIQFGYVIFFSSIFPPAGILSMICNYFEMKQSISNLKYKKKFKAEVSTGIGNFMECLNILSTFAIMINAFLICFTSKVFKKLFTGQHELDVKPIASWEVATFLTLVFGIEHIMMLVKIIVEFTITKHPEFIKTGEMEREIIAKNLYEKIKSQRKVRSSMQIKPKVSKKPSVHASQEWD